MKIPSLHPCTAAVLAASLLTALVVPPGFATAEPSKEKEDEEVLILSPFVISAPSMGGYGGGGMGATVGGAQDARYFRDAVKRGGFPHPDTITAEGLFSEHDLPLRQRIRGRELLVLNAEAMPAAVLTKPEVRYLAQIGLSSGLDAKAWRREPLNLVAVVDKSGSMDGEPLDLVRRSLHQVLSQLGPEDQLSIVLYGDRSHVHLEPTRTTPGNREAIASAIDAIESAGSTNMEAGLRVGFDLARRSQRGFAGRTRLMQFTDERPNTGDTSEAGFMALMEAGARDGIGQTTIGVGEQFDAEMAARISSVRGGNQFFFANTEEMEKTFREELDTMVTELAHDFVLKVRPAPGLRIAGIYGIPAEMGTWDDERNVSFRISTMFLSKRKGAIYVAFAPESADLPQSALRSGQTLATVNLSYREVGQVAPKAFQLEVPLVETAKASIGLRRGRVLVSEYLGLKEAMAAHLTENNQSKAYRVLQSLDILLQDETDRALRQERKLVRQLTKTMGKLSGRGIEISKAAPKADEEIIVLNGCF